MRTAPSNISQNDCAPGGSRPELRVSVVVPVLNEAAGIAAFLTALQTHDVAEIIVADGGSTDGTGSRVEQVPGVRRINAPPGRGTQMHAGAHAAGGDIVLLLHADTQLPASAIDAIRDAMADPDVVGGCFRLAFDRPDRLLALSAWVSRFDTPLTTFGDQAFFLRRDTLSAIGGVPSQPLFEDVALRLRAKRAGRFVKLPLAVTTSARRFGRTGALRQQIGNALLLGGYFIGLPVTWLARRYPPHRARDSR
jgi:rSAM/selenodomain-associated transferase 2